MWSEEVKSEMSVKSFAQSSPLVPAQKVQSMRDFEASSGSWSGDEMTEMDD
jgi:hypothetical protein